MKTPITDDTVLIEIGEEGCSWAFVDDVLCHPSDAFRKRVEEMVCRGVLLERDGQVVPSDGAAVAAARDRVKAAWSAKIR